MSNEQEPSIIAAAYYKTLKPRFAGEVSRDRVATIVSLARGKRVLDVGCVDHFASHEVCPEWLHGNLQKAAAELVGMDYEAEEVQKLKERGYNVVTGDATNFDLGRTFEMVTAGEILEHLLDARGFLASIRKHLEPGGKVVLTVPNANSVNYFMQNLMLGYEADGYDHVAFYTPMTLHNLLRKCGFEVEQIIFVEPPVFAHHERLAHRLAARLVWLLQKFFVCLRPSMARQFVAVAKPIN